MSTLRHDSYTGAPTTSGHNDARILSIIGIVCAVLGVIFMPFVFGPAAIVLGVLGYRKGDRLGLWAAVAGAASIVLGMVVGAMLFAKKT